MVFALKDFEKANTTFYFFCFFLENFYNNAFGKNIFIHSQENFFVYK